MSLLIISYCLLSQLTSRSVINKSDIYMVTVSELTVWLMPSGGASGGGCCLVVSGCGSNSGGGSVLFSRGGLAPLPLPLF